MLRTLNDVPEPDDAISCGSWLPDGTRVITFAEQTANNEAGAKLGVGVLGDQDQTGAVELFAYVDSHLHFRSPEVMREFAALVLNDADLLERLQARQPA